MHKLIRTWRHCWINYRDLQPLRTMKKLMTILYRFMIQDRSSSYFNFSIMHQLINAQMHEINSSAAIQMKAATILDRPSGCTIAATIKQYWQSCINLIFKIINRAGNQNSQVTILFINTKSSQFSYLYRQVPIHSIFHFCYIFSLLNCLLQILPCKRTCILSPLTSLSH